MRALVDMADDLSHESGRDGSRTKNPWSDGQNRSCCTFRHLVSSRPDAGYPDRVLTLATPEAAREARTRIGDALDLLDAHVPWWSALRDSSARRLVLFESTNLFGFTSPLVPLTLFVNAACDVVQFAERLVHEATHGQL